jgi:transposase
MDNLCVHTSGWVRELVEERGRRLWLLPCYSPEMNPIEEALRLLRGATGLPIMTTLLKALM